MQCNLIDGGTGVAKIKIGYLRKAEKVLFLIKIYSMYSKYLQGVEIFAKKISNKTGHVLSMPILVLELCLCIQSAVPGHNFFSQNWKKKSKSEKITFLKLEMYLFKIRNFFIKIWQMTFIIWKFSFQKQKRPIFLFRKFLFKI